MRGRSFWDKKLSPIRRSFWDGGSTFLKSFANT